jgi:hypothetical protein
MKKRNRHIDKSKKWEDFRQRRIQIIDSYIAQRKRIEQVNSLLKLIGLFKMMSSCENQCKAKLDYKMMIYRSRLMACWIAVRWKRGRRKWGKNLTVINTN